MGPSAIFVDHFDHRSVDAEATVVALTPEAFEECRRRGLNPSVVDDHSQPPEFSRHPAEYQRWQLDWLARLDDACGLDGVARACAGLIVAPLDSVVVAARTLAGVVDALRPREITYIGRAGPVEPSGYHNGNLAFWPRLGDTPLAARLLPLIAAARDVPVDIRGVSRETMAELSRASLLRRTRVRLAKTLGPYRRARLGHVHRTGRGGTTLMLWYAGYGARQFAADEHRAARDTVYVTRGGAACQIVDPAVPPQHRPSPRVDLGFPSITALKPALRPLLDEIDEWAGVAGAGGILESRLATYLHGMCGAVARAAEQMGTSFATFEIDRIAAANPSSLEEFACLIAGTHAGIRRILIQHGDHLLTYSTWLVTETQNFDELAASDPTVAGDLVVDAKALGDSTVCDALRAASARLADESLDETAPAGAPRRDRLLRALLLHR